MAWISMFQPEISEAAVTRVTETLRAGWISEGRGVAAFEAAFCGLTGLPRALALNSGTSALHLAIRGLHLEPGDEVILPAQTFVATALAVLYERGKPVFADIESGGPNIDPADIARRITPRTKAICVVHYGGYPCEMDPILDLARTYGLSVIEDAAHAIGATYKGRPVGGFGRFSAFSFQAIKQVTTGDGGMLVCQDLEDHEYAYRGRWFGIDRVRRTPSELGPPEWDIQELGYKYHMNDVAAALGLAGLEAFEPQQRRRQELNTLYRSRLSSVPGLTLLNEADDRESACWLFTALVERRVDFVRAMRSREIEASVWHRRIDHNSLLGGTRHDLPNQAYFDDHQVSVPMRHNLTDDEAGRVLDAIQAGW